MVLLILLGGPFVLYPISISVYLICLVQWVYLMRRQSDSERLFLFCLLFFWAASRKLSGSPLFQQTMSCHVHLVVPCAQVSAATQCMHQSAQMRCGAYCTLLNRDACGASGPHLDLHYQHVGVACAHVLAWAGPSENSSPWYSAGEELRGRDRSARSTLLIWWLFRVSTPWIFANGKFCSQSISAARASSMMDWLCHVHAKTGEPAWRWEAASADPAGAHETYSFQPLPCCACPGAQLNTTIVGSCSLSCASMSDIDGPLRCATHVSAFMNSTRCRKASPPCRHDALKHAASCAHAPTGPK